MVRQTPGDQRRWGFITIGVGGGLRDAFPNSIFARLALEQSKSPGASAWMHTGAIELQAPDAHAGITGSYRGIIHDARYCGGAGRQGFG